MWANHHAEYQESEMPGLSQGLSTKAQSGNFSSIIVQKKVPYRKEKTNGKT